MQNEIKLGETLFYRIKDDSIEEYVCCGRAEHLQWDDEEEVYTPLTFLYGRNDKTISFCFLAHSHPAFKHELLLGKDVFLSAAEAEKELISRKAAEAAEEAKRVSDINNFKIKKCRKRVRQ